MPRLRYPPPKNEYDFELLCLRLLRKHWQRPELQLHGRRGDKQDGIDIFDPTAKSPVKVAQCKLHDGKSLPPREIRSEVLKAERFPGHIDIYQILTTGSLTTHAQRTVKQLNEEQAIRGSFSIEVLGWEEIEDLLDQYPRVREGFYGFVGNSRVVSRLRSVFVIGGVTTDDNVEKRDRFVLQTRGVSLGEALAQSGANLFVCSPFEDSVDLYVAHGYAKANVGGTIHFVSPKHESVVRQFEQLGQLLPKSTAEIEAWWQPQWEEEESRGQAYLYCQLEALLRSDALICIGGRVDKTATMLIHFAEARRKTVVPFSFLGGAAKRAFDRNKASFPEGVAESLSNADEVTNTIAIANKLATEQAKRRLDGKKVKEFFVSHSKHDREFALVFREVAENAGFKVVFGDDVIISDRGVEVAIESAIRRVDVFVVMWSQSFACSPWCFDELMLADTRQNARLVDIWVFNIDGSQVVPRCIRDVPETVIAKSTANLRTAIANLLDATV